MSIRHLDRLFEPRSVAIVGASQRPGRIGTTVLDNMAGAGFAGALWPVNPKYDTLLGIACHARVAALPAAPDLAVICTPADTVPGIVAELGARGTRAAIVLTALSPGQRAAMLKAARPHLLRILGPGGIGLIGPAAGVNASVAHVGARPGRTAFVSQSGMLMTAVLDWAHQHQIGFSRVVSVGEGGDVDVADLLDWLAGDADTQAIVLHIESVTGARKFMSAARIAARGKPVVVLKSGRGGEQADRVADAAIRRAGMLRVYSSADLFDAVQTVARARPLPGERLAVVSNAASLGLLATDAMAWTGGRLAALSPATLRALKPLAADGVPAANPLDIGTQADTARHVAAVRALLDEPQADALLLVHVPTPAAGSAQVARALVPAVRGARQIVLSCWLGGHEVAEARSVFADAGLATYDTPEKAVRAFRQMVQYRRNQALVIEVPAGVPAARERERAAARGIVAAARQAGRAALDEGECRTVLAAYGLQLGLQPGPQSAVQANSQDRFPGGVPAADEGAPVLRIGMHADPVFGPALEFGMGGAAGRVARDCAAGLPPLNMVLARDIVARTRAGNALAAPGAQDHVCRALVQVAELVTDLPGVVALELDPMQVVQLDAAPLQDGAAQPGYTLAALRARIGLGPPRPESALAIRPYPQGLAETIDWQGAPLVLRPIRPEDAPAHVRFFAALDAEDVRLRFFSALRELPPAQLARLTQIDYDRAMAFIATRPGPDGMPATLGVVRAVADPDNRSAEFAIAVRSDLKGQGLGVILFGKLVDYFRARGTGSLTGDALAENIGVQKLVRRFGGMAAAGDEAGIVRLIVPLHGKLS